LPKKKLTQRKDTWSKARNKAFKGELIVDDKKLYLAMKIKLVSMALQLANDYEMQRFIVPKDTVLS
jgi:hypothetical protein